MPGVGQAPLVRQGPGGGRPPGRRALTARSRLNRAIPVDWPYVQTGPAGFAPESRSGHTRDVVKNDSPAINGADRL